jgi:hypothetical protein
VLWLTGLPSKNTTDCVDICGKPSRLQKSGAYRECKSTERVSFLPFRKDNQDCFEITEELWKSISGAPIVQVMQTAK